MPSEHFVQHNVWDNFKPNDLRLVMPETLGQNQGLRRLAHMNLLNQTQKAELVDSLIKVFRVGWDNTADLEKAKFLSSSFTNHPPSDSFLKYLLRNGIKILLSTNGKGPPADLFTIADVGWGKMAPEQQHNAVLKGSSDARKIFAVIGFDFPDIHQNTTEETPNLQGQELKKDATEQKPPVSPVKPPKEKPAQGVVRENYRLTPPYSGLGLDGCYGPVLAFRVQSLMRAGGSSASYAQEWMARNPGILVIGGDMYMRGYSPGRYPPRFR